jgi:hypothetical protein
MKKEKRFCVYAIEGRMFVLSEERQSIGYVLEECLEDPFSNIRHGYIELAELVEDIEKLVEVQKKAAKLKEDDGEMYFDFKPSPHIPISGVVRAKIELRDLKYSINNTWLTWWTARPLNEEETKEFSTLIGALAKKRS